MNRLLIIILTSGFLGCEAGDLVVMGSFASKTKTIKTEIFALSQIAAESGDVVRVSGINLTEGMWAEIDGKKVALSISSSGVGSFVMPKADSTGKLNAVFYSNNNETLATLSLLNGTVAEKIPVMDVDPGAVCSDQSYQNSSGEVKTGSRNCSAEYLPCEKDGQSACAANQSFPAVNIDSLKSQKNTIRTQLAIADVQGAMRDCEMDGDVGCFAVSPSYAAAIIAGASSKLVSGLSLAGVSGTLNARPADCIGDNGIGCVASPQFPSVIKTDVTPAVIKNGSSILGVLGQYPSVAFPLASATATPDITNFVSQLTTNGSFEFFDSIGNRYLGAGDGDLTAANVRVGVDLENLTISGIAPVVLPKAPSPMTQVYSNTPSDSITLAWQNTAAAGYILIRKPKGPVDWVPAHGVTYTAGAQGSSAVLYVGTGTSFVDTNIVTSSSYHYAVYAYDANHNYSSEPVRAFNTLSMCAGATNGGTWVAVPGDLQQGTSDFCVMKYTASNVSLAPFSGPSLNPWVGMNNAGGISACQGLGSNYDSISNNEYLTVAVNIASNAANWSGGSVGAGYLNSGHTDMNPSFACPASADDNLAYLQGDCTNRDKSSDTFHQKRTHFLTSGDVVWDIGGNIWQMNSTVVDWESKPFVSADGGPVGASRDYRNVDSDFSSLSRAELAPLHSQYDFWDDNWNVASQSIGAYFAHANYTGGIVVRGSAWGEAEHGGVFGLTLAYDRNSAPNWVSFRCVYRP